jgi:acyl-CoA synthetase (AMP-forming)/AMP-acid ligase II
MRVELTIGDFLRRAALVYPERIAVVDEPHVDGSLGELSYASLARRAASLASKLDELEVPHGARVAIVSPNSARFLVSFFGVSAYGRVLVPINFRLNAEEISYIVEHSGADVVLFDPEMADVVRGLDVSFPVALDGVADVSWFDEFPDRSAPLVWDGDEDATCSINYTSGTTARPKGVQLTHRNCWLNATIFGWHVGVSDRDVMLHTLPMFHANGWGMPWTTAGMGVTQVALRKVDGPEILRRVDRHGVTLLCAAPAVVNAVLDAAADLDGPVPGAGTTRVVVAGAPPPSRTIERIESELGWEFIQIYGLTETSPVLTVNRARPEWDDLPSDQRARRLMRAGAPAIGTALTVDEHGEVLARSNTVMAGYWRQPEESAAALAGGWFHTGDGGLVDDEGHLSILDRKKDVIITGGENVSSIEVEDAIFSLEGVTEVAVIGVPHEKWGEMVLALVVVDEASGVTEEIVITHCRTVLAGYKCPKEVELRTELPRTATGKLQKFRLRAPYWEGLERQVN